MGKLRGPAQALAKSLHPMLFKRALKFRDERSFYANLRVAPVILVLRVSAPFARKTGRAGERHLPIGHEDAPMGAAVRAVHAPRCRGMIVGELASRFSHNPHVGIVQTPT